MRVDKLKPDGCEIHSENFHWQADALVIGIGNGCQAGGGQQLCPEARVNDGLLNLRIFTVIKELLPALLTTVTNTEESAGVIDASSAWFDITSPNKMTFNLDGDPLTGHHFFMDIQPGAITCRLPPDCPLLK